MIMITRLQCVLLVLVDQQWQLHAVDWTSVMYAQVAVFNRQ